MKYHHENPDFAGTIFVLVLAIIVGLCLALVIGDEYHDWFCCLH